MVEAAKIKARLRVKFPKANLSTKRLDEISAKLAKKPEDGADDDAIDAVLEDYNDNGAMTFEEIAKTDDKVRTLEARKSAAVAEVEVEEDEPTTEIGKLMKVVSGLANTINTMQQQSTQQTIAQRFSKDERLKGIPQFMLKGRVPTKDEDFETTIEDILADWTPYAEKNKLDAFNGEDVPPGSETTAADRKGKVKEIDADMAKLIAGG